MAQDNLEALIKQHDIEVTPDNQLRIGSIGKTVPIPDSRVDIAGYISGVVRAEQRAQSLRADVTAGASKPLPGIQQSPADAFVNKLQSMGPLTGAATNLAIGAMKGVGSTGTNLANMIPGVNRMIPAEQKEFLSPQGTMQDVGKTVEQAGEFMLPAADAIRGAGIASGLATRLPIAATRILPEAAAAAGVAGLQGGDPLAAGITAGISPEILRGIGRLISTNPVLAAGIARGSGYAGAIIDALSHPSSAIRDLLFGGVSSQVSPAAIKTFSRMLQTPAVTRPIGRAVTGISSAGQQLLSPDQAVLPPR